MLTWIMYATVQSRTLNHQENTLPWCCKMDKGSGITPGLWCSDRITMSITMFKLYGYYRFCMFSSPRSGFFGESVLYGLKNAHPNYLRPNFQRHAPFFFCSIWWFLKNSSRLGNCQLLQSIAAVILCFWRKEIQHSSKYFRPVMYELQTFWLAWMRRNTSRAR